MKKFVARVTAITIGLWLLPAFAFAQAQNVFQLLVVIVGVINGFLVPLVFSLAFIVFVWGVFMYFVAGASDEDKREKGKNLMIYGLIGFFVMASVWGIVNLLVNTFELDTNVDFNVPQAPSVPGGGGGGGSLWPGT